MTSNKIARLFGAATVFAAAAGVSTAQADTVAAWQGSCGVNGGGSTACSALISPADTAPNIPPNASATFTTLIIGPALTGHTFTPAVSGVYNFTAADNSVAGFLGSALATAIGGDYFNGASSTTAITSTSGLNTEWRFTFSVSSPQLLSVTHDDGIALFGGSGVIKPDNETTDAAAIPQRADGATLYSLATVQTTLTPTTVPLPATAWLFGAGLAGLGLLTRRRRNSGLASAV